MLTTPLHPYQNEPVDKFLRRGSLMVAYEMGLGKTPIAIAAAETLLGSGEINTCLIVCPANLRWQWAMALAKFTDVPTYEKPVKDQTITVPAPNLCMVIEGTTRARAFQFSMIAECEEPVEYIIMSYESVVNDWKYVRQLHPGMVVLDEATAIKSFKAKRTKKIKQLTAPYRLALTGTPIENRPEELFSIMQWVDNDVLGRYDLFDKAYVVRNKFGGVLRYKNLGILHLRLGPAMSRRNRLDPLVAPYLPTVDHGVWEVTMDSGSRRVHNTIAQSLLSELAVLRQTHSDFDLDAHYGGDSNGDMSQAGKVMAIQQALEMFLDHPDLVRKSAEDYANPDTKKGSKYAAELVASGALDGAGSSRKLDMLVAELDIILGYPGNKVIIFTKYVHMLTLIEEALDAKCVRYHGEMDATAKAAAVAQFTSDPECRVFLSSHAGAYGTDLFMANYLINYDLPWSSGKADQINGRHVRASSEFTNVFVRDVVMVGTVEERRHKLVAFKRRIGSAILDNTGQDELGRIENDLASLTEYLQSSLS